jgi:hypothetical protein
MEALLSALGLKKAVVLAGLVGGAISGGIMAGPLAMLQNIVVRIAVSAICGAGLAGYGADTIAGWLERPGAVQGVALGLGLFGLSTTLKIITAVQAFDLTAFINRKTGG